MSPSLTFQTETVLAEIGDPSSPHAPNVTRAVITGSVYERNSGKDLQPPSRALLCRLSQPCTYRCGKVTEQLMGKRQKLISL